MKLRFERGMSEEGKEKKNDNCETHRGRKRLIAAIGYQVGSKISYRGPSLTRSLSVSLFTTSR
ncbi:hypothetical protein YC2023_012082 [Brassica napus]